MTKDVDEGNVTWELVIAPLRLTLQEPNVDIGILQWLECELERVPCDSSGADDETKLETVGTVRVLHFSLSRSRYEPRPIEDILDADSDEALDLLPLFVNDDGDEDDDNWWADAWEVPGTSLIYVSRMQLSDEAVQANVPAAIVQRLVDLFDPAMTVVDPSWMPPTRWAELGFVDGPKKTSTNGQLMIRDEQKVAPRVVEEDGRSAFRIVHEVPKGPSA